METGLGEKRGRTEATLLADLVGRGAAGVNVVQAQGRAVSEVAAREAASRSTYLVLQKW